jgi:hypothetical protein
MRYECGVGGGVMMNQHAAAGTFFFSPVTSILPLGAKIVSSSSYIFSIFLV